jgi:hypothetical protein
MSQPPFDRLSERLLHAGIAPRHVRRYVRELSDHFDDLVREEKAGGAARDRAGTRALSRLGNDDDLANAMLSRPELRSLTARYPWAVFGLGPIVMIALSVVAALYLEFGLLTFFNWVIHGVMGYTPASAAAKVANAKMVTQIFTAYNTLVVYGAPLVFAWLFYRIGSRQRMPTTWIVTGVALVCVLGGFQNVVFYDTGVKHGGMLMVSSGLYPPFPHLAESLARAALNLAIAGSVWWLSAKRKASHTMALSHIVET